MLLSLLFASTDASIQYSQPEALAAEITNLPGQPKDVPFRQFSGYIPTTSGEVFYWYVESANSPESAPTVWWTNGGPGCSGLAGLLTENGPFRPQPDGTLDMNHFSWNLRTNMVFVEQPIGVGFSIASNPDQQYGDSLAATENHEFLEGFFGVFPELRGNDLYLTSESYGGHYLPTLAQEIVRQGKLTDIFRGFAVGNPLTWMPYRDYGQWGTWWGHQLLPLPLWEDYNKNNCKTQEFSDACNKIYDQMSDLTQDLDPYALNFPVCTSAESAGRHERHNIMTAIRRYKRHLAMQNGAMLDKAYFPENYQPCGSEYATTYLNRKDVQQALHTKKGNWQECSDTINQNWNVTDLGVPMMPIYQYLIAEGNNLNIMVYSGNDDSVCATLGSQQFIWDTFAPTSGQEWGPWMTGNGADAQVSGYTQGFKGFRFTTVNGAGHMVPSTRPAQSLDMFTKYLANDWP
jgi:carboxypeptidase C (cathepsin A)